MLHTVRMGFLFHPLNFTLAERSAMRLDGEITPADSLIDLPDDWVSRVTRALWGHRSNAVLTGLSAAWALGAHAEPEHHTVTALPGHSQAMTPRMNFRSEERTLEGVTTPLRTLSDLLRSSHLAQHQGIQICRELMHAQQVTSQHVRDYILAMKYVPYSRIALQRLGEIEVT
ncbi:MAG: hypothetical protein RLZZ52_437 [Actinomycetota bacterium]